MNMRRSEIGLKLQKSLWRILNVHAARINLGTVSGAEHRLCGAAPVTCALDRKSTRLNSRHSCASSLPFSACNNKMESVENSPVHSKLILVIALPYAIYIS